MSVWREDFRVPPYGYPIPINRRWNGLRSDLEAAVRYNRVSYFFKGGKYVHSYMFINTTAEKRRSDLC